MTEVQCHPPEYPELNRWEQRRASNLWTPAIRKAVREGDCAVLYFHRVVTAPSWMRSCCFVEMKISREVKRGIESNVTIEMAGRIDNGHQDAVRSCAGGDYVLYEDGEDNRYAPESGTWVLHLWPDGHAKSCLLSIPLGAAVTFRVSLDALSSPVLAERALHGDQLSVEVQKGKRSMKFNLDSQSGLHNSARFGRSHM